MNLTDHFKLEEFLISKTYPELAAAMIPTLQQKTNLLLLCTYVLEPLRVNTNKPLIITSGLRTPEMNKLLGGTGTSQHLDGTACDFYIQNYDNRALFKRLLLTHQGQLFYYLKSGHIHIALPRFGTIPSRKIMNK